MTDAISRNATVLSWSLQIIAAAILLQTLFFKFTGSEESRYIFSTLGVEPWGRIASGVVELIAATLLLIPATAGLGAALSVAVMLGAVGAHLTRLGLVVKDDGGLLFALALTVLACGSVLTFLHRRQLLAILRSLAPVAG
ncbi:MAG: DoxX family protein [Phycisphaerae bacterium]|nr:DoxX family protein [Phycisphaerae bacterium]